jgi:hypothetical protein
MSIDASAVRLLTSQPNNEDAYMPARFEFTIPEDRWGLEKAGVVATDTIGVPRPMPDDLSFGPAPDLANDAIQEVRYSAARGSLVIHTVDDGVLGGSGTFLAMSGGNVIAEISVTLGPVTGLQLSADNSPVKELLTDPDAPA